MDKILINTIPSVRAAETQYKAHFTQKGLFLLIFIIKMLQPAETNLHAKMQKITITFSGFRNSDENPNNSSPV